MHQGFIQLRRRCTSTLREKKKAHVYRPMLAGASFTFSSGYENNAGHYIICGQLSYMHVTQAVFGAQPTNIP